MLETWLVFSFAIKGTDIQVSRKAKETHKIDPIVQLIDKFT